MTTEKIFNTEQEIFRAGEFGTEYIWLNSDDKFITSNLALFRRAMKSAVRIDDCIEFDANIDINFEVLRWLYPGQIQYAVEINQNAARELRANLPAENVIDTSTLDFGPVEVPY